MQMQLEQTQSKSGAILAAIESSITSGQLTPGSKLQSMRTFAKEFSASVTTVRHAFKKLETDGVIESKRGLGVFIKQNYKAQINQELTFLIPYANFFIASDQSGIMARRMYMGMCDSDNFKNINLLPVSKNATVALETIDYAALERITPGATVVIDGKWYEKLFPFFAERNIRGIFVADQEEYGYAEEHGFSSLLINRSGAIEDAVCHLANLGHKRIAILKCGAFNENNPFRAGYLNGLERSQLTYDPALIKVFPTQKMFPMIDYQYFKTLITELWQANKFDALLLSLPDISVATMTILQHELGLAIPDDVAVMTLYDRMEHVNSAIPITAIEFPWHDMGVECARLAADESVALRSIKFNASIVERESIRKGAGGFVNTKLLPEYQHIIDAEPIKSTFGNESEVLEQIAV